MLEILMIVAACVAMARIASADDQSVGLWVGVTIALCLASLMIPLPFVRVLLAAVAAFVAMIGYKVWQSRS